MVLTRRMLTATSERPLPASAAVPHRSSVVAVPQPAVQPARLYVVVPGKVVANLPYLPEADRLCYPDLADEPDEALYTWGDGLGLYRRLLRSAEDRLCAGGAVMFQLHRRVHVVERAELAAVRSRLEDLVPEPANAAGVGGAASWAW